MGRRKGGERERERKGEKGGDETWVSVPKVVTTDGGSLWHTSIQNCILGNRVCVSQMLRGLLL